MDTWTDGHRGTPWTPRKASLWSEPGLAALYSALILNQPLHDFIGNGRNPVDDPDRIRSAPLKKPWHSPPRNASEPYKGIPNAASD